MKLPVKGQERAGCCALAAVLLTMSHRQALHLAPIRPHSRTGFSGRGSSG
jgi:hypothetical protein